MDVDRLKSYMYRNHDKMEDLAAKLDISSRTLYLKFNGKADFRVSEIKKIIKLYSIPKDEVLEIFFTEQVA